MRTTGLALLLALLGCPALALDAFEDRPSQGGLIYEMKIGALAHDVPITLNYKEPVGPDLNLEITFGPSLPFLFGTIRLALGGTINFAGYTSKAYLDARWEVECCWGAFFAAGLGAAYHDGHLNDLVNYQTLTGAALANAIATSDIHKQLGARVLFHPTMEWGYRFNDHNSLSIFYEHISNANSAPKNEGLENLGVRYGYRF